MLFRSAPPGKGDSGKGVKVPVALVPAGGVAGKGSVGRCARSRARLGAKRGRSTDAGSSEAAGEGEEASGASAGQWEPAGAAGARAKEAAALHGGRPRWSKEHHISATLKLLPELQRGMLGCCEASFSACRAATAASPYRYRPS